MNRIGDRIKLKRKDAGMRLNELAAKVGISPSALSQIEKAKSNPAVTTLKLIAENLNTTVGDLIGENESISNNPVFRYEESIQINQNDSGTKLFSLTQHDNSKQMNVMMIRFEKNSNSLDLLRNFHNHMFGMLLNGELQFNIDNKTYVIRKGDTVYFDTRRNYLFENLINGVSELLCVVINK